MNAGVTDIGRARARRENAPITLTREPLTIICQVANVRSDAEVLRQIGFSDALTFDELHNVIATCFGFPDEDSPWHFYEHRAARGARIDPKHQVSEFLWKEGDQIDFVWGLWDFQLVVEEIYPRDAGTPRALCVGGAGRLFEHFDITAVNAELTGQDTIDEVLSQVTRPARRLIERSQLFDFVPLLQALEFQRVVRLAPDVVQKLKTLPKETTAEGEDAFWSMALGLACMGGAEMTDSVIKTTMSALGWVDDDGKDLTGDGIRTLCKDSLAVLEEIGAYGTSPLAPVDRLDIYRALLRG
ncbi:MAG: hypothetical protein SPJ78_09205 [Corynebacterium camporealensis]|uniref:hypothetical protein n=1 Tax=Corynebacterium camporealensis TaxID=161896 RepID=UPI002A91E37D|nr:hypothetical protein [Corynebacterium camporealensis]MDY5840867.1 hypothetical protein [Corynebacterium camporealensis]